MFKRNYLKIKRMYAREKYRMGGGERKEIFQGYYRRSAEMHDRKTILTGIYNILSHLDNEVGAFEDVTVICIGDSPSILLQIYKMLFPVNLSFLPISSIGSSNVKEIRKRLSGLDLTTSRIIWVDYISSGRSLLKMIDAVDGMENLKKRSKFFAYGHVSVQDPKYAELRDKVHYIHQVDKSSVLYSFLASLIGNSELYDIRCVERMEVDKIEPPIIHGIEKLPTDKMTSQYCTQYAWFLYQEMKNIGLTAASFQRSSS